jgi:hypothetical protein
MRGGITGMSNHEGCILQIEANCGAECCLTYLKCLTFSGKICIALKVLCQQTM